MFISDVIKIYLKISQDVHDIKQTTLFNLFHAQLKIIRDDPYIIGKGVVQAKLQKSSYRKIWCLDKDKYVCIMSTMGTTLWHYRKLSTITLLRYIKEKIQQTRKTMFDQIKAFLFQNYFYIAQ